MEYIGYWFIHTLPVMSTSTKLEKVINISMSGKWYHDIIVGAEPWLIKIVRPHHFYALQDYIGR